jgi:transcription termination factor Rho
MSDDNQNLDTVQVEGILEPQPNKTGQLLNPDKNGKTRPTDPFVPKELVRRFKLKKGHYVVGSALHDARFPNPKVRFIESVDGLNVEERRKKLGFQQLTTIAPDERLHIETQGGPMTTRIIELF